jgi:2-polyprenyl-6-methoxyphenol hydroxylase-like FAD-dependent oxidoreductase
MSARDLSVMVIGGGIGGLCLAQGLRKAGVKVAVYERDETPTSRLQGFRVHINPQGSMALHDCLPPELWLVFDKTGGAFTGGFTMMTEQLSELMHISMDDERTASAPVARHRSVSRITLRHIMLRGLEGIVHFNKRFVRYEETETRVIAHFDDGSTAEADVLVAADGVNSRVRKQYLPDAEPIDTGVMILGGKLRLTDGALAVMPSRLLDGPMMIMPPEPASASPRSVALQPRPRYTTPAATSSRPISAAGSLNGPEYTTKNAASARISQRAPAISS